MNWIVILCLIMVASWPASYLLSANQKSRPLLSRQIICLQEEVTRKIYLWLYFMELLEQILSMLLTIILSILLQKEKLVTSLDILCHKERVKLDYLGMELNFRSNLQNTKLRMTPNL